MSAPSSTFRSLCAAATLGLLPGCEAPPVEPSQDPSQAPERATSRIEGSVVVTGRTRGNVILFLYDAANPPPPAGSGRPVTFVTLPAAEVFGNPVDTSSSGPFIAPFIFSRIKPGNYLLRGIIDRDECVGSTSTTCRKPDFIPWFWATNEPNRGDVGGAAVDAVTREVRVIQVKDDLQPVTNVGVSFADSAMVPVDRPVFSVTSGNGTFNPASGTKFLDLTTTAISSGLVNQRAPTFLARYIDNDNDGQPDDANKDGAPDFWPKVLVRKLDTSSPLSTNLVEEASTRYERADGSAPPATGVDVPVIAAGIVPQPIVAALTNPDTGQPRRDATGAFATVPVDTLKIALQPFALDISNPAVPTRLKGVPPGRYAIIVLNLTGQSWRVPNELQPATATAFGGQEKLPPTESQAFVIDVPPPATTP